MTDPYDIPRHERGVVRVFTTDLDPEGNAAITAGNVQKLLGDGLDLDPSKIEVFPSKNIQAMGLAAYLREGYGIPDEDLAGKVSALDALHGLIILVASSAFRGEKATLDPNPALRFIGAFHEPGMEPPKPMPPSETAAGQLSPGGTALPPTTGRKPGALVILAALVLAAIVVLLLVL